MSFFVFGLGLDLGFDIRGFWRLGVDNGWYCSGGKVLVWVLGRTRMRQFDVYCDIDFLARLL